MDEQTRGPFRQFHDEHEFIPAEAGTTMIDRISFDAHAASFATIWRSGSTADCEPSVVTGLPPHTWARWSCSGPVPPTTTDILIRDVPDDVLTAIDAKAKRVGRSRSEQSVWVKCRSAAIANNT